MRIYIKSQSNSVLKNYLESLLRFRKEHWKKLPFYYQGVEDFLLQHGKQFESSPLTEEEEEIVFKALEEYTQVFGDPQPQHCFDTSQRIMRAPSNLMYAEGYVYNGIGQTRHGWNVINGKVIDFVLQHPQKTGTYRPITGVIPEGWEYFGMEVPSKLVFENMLAELKRVHERGDGQFRVVTPVLDNYEQDFPLLRKKYNPNDHKESAPPD